MTAKPDLDQPTTKQDIATMRIVRTMICSHCDYDAGEDPISTRRCPGCHHVNTFHMTEVRR